MQQQVMMAGGQDMTEWEDDRLMAAIAGGNQQAATAFIRRHLPYVLKICRAHLQREAEAEEAAQDVFMSVWKNAGHWQAGSAKVTTWLYRVAANRCIDLLRRRRPQDSLDAVAELADEADNSEALQQASDRHRLIQTAMDALSDDQKQAIELVYFKEMNQRDAAEMMDMTLAALESVLRRARQRLHNELAVMKNQLHAI